MVSSGVPSRNGDNHAPEIAFFALDVMDSLKDLYIPHLLDRRYILRVGIHTGTDIYIYTFRNQTKISKQAPNTANFCHWTCFPNSTCPEI